MPDTVFAPEGLPTQLLLPATWAAEPDRDPVERLVALEKDRSTAREEIGEVVQRLARRHAVSPRSVAVAVRTIEAAIDDLLFEPTGLLLHDDGVGHAA